MNILSSKVLIKAKNTDMALVMASIFNDEHEFISRNICGINSVN